MAKLVTPNQSCHQYVVGIDFGHGETSAAICPLEWKSLQVNVRLILQI